MTLEEKEEKLKEISQEISSCRRCSLYKTATQAVPGEGNPNTKIMFIGEAPGFFEDKQGKPFVGQAGKLLEQLLQLIKVARKDVWIGNLIKHRPPGNRDPLSEEIQSCSVWLDKQIEIINPEIIVTLGRFSMAKFLPGESISKIHGTSRMVYWNSRKIMVMPMYHPAAGLRNGGILKELRNDFSKLGQLLNKKLATQRTLK
ncbi:MAG: uracil-DNA glycosylase family protein [Patescibacteria group bacterium]